MKRVATEIPADVLALERQVELINRFPDQNPHPVMRMTDGGVLLYANRASAEVLASAGAEVGRPVPTDLLRQLREALAAGEGGVAEVASGLKTFALLPVAVPEFSFVNVYGTDITASKVIARFPDRNPNPVFRVSDEGVLLYANNASREVTSAFGRTIGQLLPDAVRQQIQGAIDGTMEPSFEIMSEGRSYLLLPVRIAEFGFINVYGTDITARKAITKFPDQNPNPVLRVGQDGRLVYANAASELVREAFGAQVGEPLQPEVFAAIRDRVDRRSDDTIEVEHEGRSFALLVKDVPEFKFINLYGTDITAARQVERAHELNRRLLLNILPEPIADRLRAGESIIADRFEEVTLLFADIVDFTQMSSRMTPNEVVDVLNAVFRAFDDLVEHYDLEKIKTIGDAYMVVGGLPGQPDDHAGRVAEMALRLAAEVEVLEIAQRHTIRFRVGISMGPVVAGVIGRRKFIYDVWGDTVNTASRMESLGVPGRIQVTQPVYERLRDRFRFEARGSIDVKGKGPMATWFLTGRIADAADHVDEIDSRHEQHRHAAEAPAAEN